MNDLENRELVIKRHFNFGLRTLSCAEIAVALEHAYHNFFFSLIFFTLREYKPLCSDFDLFYRDLVNYDNKLFP